MRLVRVTNPLSKQFLGQLGRVIDVYPDGAVKVEIMDKDEKVWPQIIFARKEFVQVSQGELRMNKPCACGCGKIVGAAPPFMPYKIHGKPEEYATRECMDAAFNGLRRPVKRREPDRMKVPHPDFGDSGVAQQLCDHDGEPVTVAWRGKNGVYCSLDCRQAAEGSTDQGENMTDTATDNDSPIAAGTPAATAKKTASKKAAAKKAPAKAAPATKKAASNGNGHSKYSDDMKLTPLKKKDETGYRDGTKRFSHFATIKPGMTLGKYKEAIGTEAVSFLKFYIEDGAVAIK